MDRTTDLLAIASEARGQHGSEISTNSQIKTASPFILSASELYQNLKSFEHLLKESSQAYVGYHRYYPKKHLLGNLAPFSEKDRQQLSEEIASFVTNSAAQIQKFHQQLDNFKHDNKEYTSSQHQFYRLMVSSLLQKLNKITVYWERLQKLQKKKNLNPCKLFSDKNFRSADLKAIAENNASSKSRKGISSVLPIKIKEKINTNSTSTTRSTNKASTDNFAQRYIDEITTPQKLRSYENIAAQQKEQLLNQHRTLEKKYSQDILLTQQMERTVLNIANMVSEFSTMLEQQTDTVVDIHDTSKQVTSSVEAADEELLKTLESSQSQQWNMLFLAVGLGVLLLLLHFISP